MTIASEIQKLNTNLTNSYTSVLNKGGTLPTSQNFDNLAASIATIPTGITPTGTISITQNGTYDVANYANANVNVSGGGSTTGEFLVQVLDYDGSVIKQDHLDTGDTFTLPEPPNHNLFVFQEWSSPVVITNNTVTVTNSDITIGAIYTTASGLSEFDITLTTPTGLTVTLNMDGTKDWGDGTSDTSTTHTYASVGDYTITCNGTTLTSTDRLGLFGQSRSYTIGITGARNTAPYLKRVRLANGISIISAGAFMCCFSLEYITIPKGVTSIGDTGTRTFASTSIPILIIPSTVTSICSRICEVCFELKNVIIPYGCTITGDYAFNHAINLERIQLYDIAAYKFLGIFQNCIGLKEVIMPLTTTATSLGDERGTTGIAFAGCSSLKKLYIPNSITTISYNSFANCASLIEYDFSDHTAVPTLSGTNAFNGINQICKIKVPAALETEWKAATNWSTYADYIVGV